MKKWILIWAAILSAFLFAAASAETYQVSPDGLSITEALELCADGDVIELADGVYDEECETFPILVTKSVTLCAAEGARPVIDAPEYVAAVRVEASSVTLEGLDIQMLRTGIYAIGDDMTLIDCSISLADEVWRTSSCGIWCGGIYDMTLIDCSFVGCSVSLAGPPLSESSTGLPVLTGLFEVGEDEKYFTSHTIENCTVNGKELLYIINEASVSITGDYGQVICCGCGDVCASEIALSDASMGMIFAYNDSVTIEDCSADRCGVFGIYVCKCSSGTVRNCTSEETNHGLDIRACTNIALIDCTATDCDQGMFFSHVEDSVMINCTVIGTGQGYFVAAGEGNALVSCTASECENGFNLQKEGTILMTCCLIEECSVCGVRMDATPTIFTSNTLIDNWVGVMAYGEVSVELIDNLFEGSLSCGLYLHNLAYSRFVGNTIIGNEGDSVQAEGTMSESLWMDNELDVAMNCDEEAVFYCVE